jgi:hypothetical protein
VARVIGKNAYIIFNSVVLSTDFRTFKEGNTADMIDKSAGADARHTYIAALADGGYDMDMLIDGTGPFVACLPGTEGTLIFGVEGTASGKPKTTVVAVASKRERSFAYNDLYVMSVSFQPSAQPTEGTY